MPVASSDIKLFKSANGDSAGGASTPTQVTGTSKNNFFADISDLERLAGGERIRKAFLGNDHATDSLLQPLVWFFPDVIGFDPTEIGYGIDDADDDTGLAGDLTALTANAQIEVVSSAADTRNVTLVGVDNATGDQTTETLVLNGTTPVLSTLTFSSLIAVFADSESGSNTITIKEGAGGTTRGTIPSNRVLTFLWVVADSEVDALKIPDLIAGGRTGIWIKQTWGAGVAAQRPATPILNVKEST